MNRIKINLVWQDFRYFKGSANNITHPHDIPKIGFKETEGKLDSYFEVTDQCWLTTYNYRP